MRKSRRFLSLLKISVISIGFIFVIQPALAESSYFANCATALSWLGNVNPSKLTEEQNAKIEIIFSDPLISGQYRSQKELRKFSSSKEALQELGYSRFAAWLLAKEFLDSIPVGQFKFDREILDRLHTILNSYHSGIWPKLAPFIIPKGLSAYSPGSPRLVIAMDLFRKKNAAVSDEDVLKLKSNSYGAKVFVLPWPWSKRGKNNVVVKYPGIAGIKVRKGLKYLEEYYEVSKTQVSPVVLSASMALRYINLHPYQESQGKMSRLIANRILAEHGLPPALLEEHEDFGRPFPEILEDYISGVARSATLLQLRKFSE